MGASLARKSRAELRSISCSSLKPKSIGPFLSAEAALGGPRLPEVVVEPPAVVQAAEGELDRHVDGDALRLAVGELEIEPPAAIEVDHGVCGGRIGALVQVVVGEREYRAAPPGRHVVEARVAAFDAGAMARELDGAALRAPATVERHELLAIAKRGPGRRNVAHARLLAQEVPEERIASIRRQRPLHLDLLRDAG